MIFHDISIACPFRYSICIYRIRSNFCSLHRYTYNISMHDSAWYSIGCRGQILNLSMDPSTYINMYTHICICTLWLFNIAMMIFQLETSIYEGFSMAMLNNQMVHMYVIVCISVCTAMVKSYIAYPYSALVITPLIEIYTSIVKTPLVGLMTIPKIACFDHGTYINESNRESECDTYIYIYHI